VAAARTHYEQRLAHWRASGEELAAKERQYTRLRLLAGLAIVASGWLAFGSRWLHPLAFPLSLAALVVLVIRHEATVRRRERAERACRLFERGLARLDGKWMGQGVSGAEYRNPHHVYSEDLDVFGVGSLFELICQARTAAGQARLAAWLCEPATLEQATARQQAVKELIPHAGLREELALLGQEIAPRLHPEALRQWGEAPEVPFPRALGWLAPLLAVMGAGTFLLWLFSQLPLSPFLLVVLATGGVNLRYRDRVERVTATLDTPAHELELISHLLGRLERECFAAPLLKRHAPQASAAIARLEALVDRLDWAHNMGFAPVAWVLLWKLQHARAIERWRVEHGRAVAGWLDDLAHFEALSSLANYAYEHERTSFPELVEGEPVWQARGLTHPLLAENRAVGNDLELGAGARLWIVSGSNMSGKSTLLRAVGLNTILAWTGAPVRATAMRLTAFSLGAAIRTVDSIMEGHSRFYAEIKRLRQIVDLTAQPLPVLFLLDELLSGTNSHDRRLGAEGILRELLRRNAFGLVTTHDLALTEIAHGLEGAGNIHLDDRFEDGEIRFDYKLRPGVVARSNALELMRSVGLPVA
jgi:hypothetical protein